MRIHEIDILIETWGQIGNTRILEIHTREQLDAMIKRANRGRQFGCDVRGFWFPDDDSVIAFSGWNLIHDDLLDEYPETRRAIRLTFPHDHPGTLWTGSHGISDQLRSSQTICRIMGSDQFGVEEGVW